MKDIVVIGAPVAGLLASTGDYQVTLVDRHPKVLGSIDRDERIRVVTADVEDSSALVDLLNGQFAVLNAAPFRLTTSIAEAAWAARTHYLDLTEDVASRRRVSDLAADADTAPSDIRAMRRSCARSSTICGCAIAGMCSGLREPRSAAPLAAKRRPAAVARPVPTHGRDICVAPPTRSISGRSFRSRRA